MYSETSGDIPSFWISSRITATVDNEILIFCIYLWLNFQAKPFGI